MHPDIDHVLITAEQLQQRVQELGAAINDTAPAKSIVLIGILKGSVFFLADLARAINHTCQIDFIAVSSYGAASSSSGVVRLMKDLDSDIEGQHVILVEDIIDSGLTLRYVLDMLQRRNPASLQVCALLSKPERREVDVHIDYVGFDIPNAFVVGYGLDYAEKYRNLPYIGVLKSALYAG